METSDIASVGVAVATLVLAFFTYLSVRQARDAQRARARPVLIPSNVPQSKEVERGEATNLDVQNVGSGVAVDVWGVILPFSDPLPWVPTQLSLRDHLPLRPGEIRRMPFAPGGTMFTHADRVGHVPVAVPPELAPEASFPNSQDRRERVVARLTLSCRDSLGLKHAFAYDLDWLDHWVSVNTGSLVRKDLRDLDAEKGSQPARRRSRPAA
jgi:hypothetical protein